MQRFLRRSKRGDGNPPPSGHLEALSGDAAATPAETTPAETTPAGTTPPGPVPTGAPPPPRPEPARRPRERRAPAAPAPSSRLVARFPTAAAALMFAGQLHSAEDLPRVRCLRGESGWWVSANLGLEAARDAALSCGGLVHVELGGLLVPDRGWGDAPAAGTGPAVRSLDEVPLVELVRTAGLARRPPAPVSEVTLLLPGTQLPGTVRRSLDLDLSVVYQRAELTPLFTGGAGRPAFAVTLRATEGGLPAALIGALERDPFVVVCRRVSERLLVQHRHESPLADHALSALVDEGVWVLAVDGHGCQRLALHGEPQPGTAFVRLGTEQPLSDQRPGDDWPDVVPEPPTITVVPARTRGLPVDAVLLTDEALAALPLVLEGHPLAETAQLVQGRDRHLLTAPGGVLEDLPVGEVLYCLGPGQLFLPLGHRLMPRLPSAARGSLFPAGDGQAIVLTAAECLGFDLTTRTPVWTLWAGPVPRVDPQVPADVIGRLQEIDHELIPAPQSQRRRTRSQVQPGPRPYRPRRVVPIPHRSRPWHEEAYTLELAGELRRAAELHARNNQPLQAARLYERAAEESGT
ncbi:hypothetical protein OHR68_12555 [Spirillospora sp. NBC_00431]